MSTASYTNLASANARPKTSNQVGPVSAPIKGREKEMARNNAGGFTFTLDQWGVLDRFLMIGTESAGYYVGAAESTAQNFDNLKACIRDDGQRVLNTIEAYSLAGRAPKNDPAVVALAVAAVYGDAETVAKAYDLLPKIARTGTWLFLFVSIINSLGKWNAAAKRGVAKWYTSKTVDRLAVQLLKYQSRNGWAHRDVLRLAHVKPTSEVQSSLFRYSVKGEAVGDMPKLINDFEALKRATTAGEVISLIEQNSDITWEMVPTQFLNDKRVLGALLPNMGMTALIRKLGALTAHGAVDHNRKLIINTLTNIEQLKNQRVHPITILQAHKQYKAGKGHKGSLVWSPDTAIANALDSSFYAAFDTIEVPDENYLIGLDISGSMWGSTVNGSPNLVAAEVGCVMAMAIARKVSNVHIFGFNTELKELKLDKKMKLDQAMNARTARMTRPRPPKKPLLITAPPGRSVRSGWPPGPRR